MSSIIPAKKHLWIALLAAGIALTLGVTFLTSSIVEHSNRPVVKRQEPWKIRVFSSDQENKLNKRQRARFRAQAPKLKKVIKRVYEGLFLDPATAATVVRRNFTEAAARSFLQAGPGLPKDSSDISIAKRKASIGIHTTSGAHASAAIRVVAGATAEAEAIRMLHRATLWLQRLDDRWKVIAFVLHESPRKKR